MEPVTTIRPTDVLRRSPRVAYRELGGDRGGVLLQLDTGAYHGVDRIGALILAAATCFGDHWQRSSRDI